MVPPLVGGEELDGVVVDIVCSLVTGAYGYSMASTYNRIGRPAVVFAANGRATTVLRRETPTT